MNAPTKTATKAAQAQGQLADIEQTNLTVVDQPPQALAPTSPASMMMAALSKGVPMDQIEKMMDLQERWEANEARKAFNDALANFKAEAVEILKTKQVSFKTSKGDTNYKHAELSGVVEAVGPALSKHGFSWSWSPAQANGWITVTCTLKHRLGHSEAVSLSGPYDDSGGKNNIQAIISAKTYLERHTLKAICGVAEKGEDDDGTQAAENKKELVFLDFEKRIQATKTREELNKLSREASKHYTDARDVKGYQRVVAVGTAHAKTLKGESSEQA